MSLSLGRQGGGMLRQVGQWVAVAAILGVILSAKDIERYLKIRNM